MDVQQVFTGYDSLNQAINQKVVGPLFKKGWVGGPNSFKLEIDFGTSIEFV